MLPTRALIKKQISADGKLRQLGDKAPPDVEMVPYIPRELASDTIDFFRNNVRMKAIVEYIFSGHDVKESPEDRAEYDEAESRMRSETEAIEAAFKVHEQRAQELCFKAIRELPAELYQEAVQKSRTPMPRQLMLHVMYNDQWFNSLSEKELVRLQAFENLMHIRYPHSEMRKKKPELFWIPATQVVSRQKEMAMKGALVDKKK